MYYNYSSKKEKDYQKFLTELAMANINYYSTPGLDILKWRGEGEMPTAMKSEDLEDVIDKIVGNGEADNDMVELDENFLLEDDETPAFEDSAIDKKEDKEGGINLHIAQDVLDKVDGDIDINIEGEDDLNTDDILGKKNEPVGPMGVDEDKKEKDEVSESYYSSRKSPLSLLEDKFENDILSALLTEMEALNDEVEDEDDKKDGGEDFADKLDNTKAVKEDEDGKKDKEEGPELDFSDLGGKDHDEDIEDLEPTDEDLKATETDDDHDTEDALSPTVDVDTSDGDIDINIKIAGDDDMSDVDEDSLGLGSDHDHDIF